MNWVKLPIVTVLFILASTMSGVASAGGNVTFGIGIGVPLGPFWGGPWYYPPSYYYPPYYYPPYYPPVAASSPPVYVERSTPQAAPPQQNSWYYCAGSQGYYPYVKECPGGWQKVPAHPPQ